MRYVSTRGLAEPVDFVTACMAGLAPDGGLYIPESWPQIAPAGPTETYAEVATRVLSAFAGDSLSATAVHTMCTAAYGRFSHHSVAPLVQTGPNAFIMELHHGPTLAFKDVAMQFIGELYEHVLSTRQETMRVVCATSGDTGGAAASAFAGRKNIELFILHPHERISPVQRQFMTTTGQSNIHNLAVLGDFDACQNMVKAMFADPNFVQAVNLSGVNSINWARIAAQSVYYATAQAALGPERALRFIVPSGNMGDAFAGYVAVRCGLLNGLDMLCAVNENRALADLLEAGRMQPAPAVQTPSPAMDISIPSNFERLLFEAAGRQGDTVRTVYETYKQSGAAQLPEQVTGPLKCMGLNVQAITNAETETEMRRMQDLTGTLICPHTAVGTAAAHRHASASDADVVLATAHAAKFPETVSEVTGQVPAFPARCADLEARAEQFEIVEADLVGIKNFIQARS